MRERLASRIRRILSPEEMLPAGGRQATVISISNQKGGVGKTTTSVNLGAGLALFHNKRVLLVDMDAQGHVGISLNHPASNGTGIGQVLASKNDSIMDVIVPTDVPHLDMTPSDHSLLEAESQLSGKIGREFILRKALTRARTYYDFIFIDCPPNLGNLTVNAYVASDYLLIPCDLSALALEGMEDILEVLDTVNFRLNHPLRILGVLTTRVDRRNLVMNEAVFERLQEVFHDKLFRTQIAVNTDLNKAQLAGKPIFTYARCSAGAKDYQSLAEELIERLQSASTPANP